MKQQQRSILIVTIIFTLFFSPFTLAASCFSPSPNQKKGKDSFKPIEAKKLNYKEKKSLRHTFKNMDGVWEGTATGFFCMGTEKAPRKKPDNYTIQEMEVDTNSSGDLTLTAQMYSSIKDSSRQETMRLYTSDDVLRVGHNKKSGDVSLDNIKRGNFTFTQRYRVPTGRNKIIVGSIEQEIIRTIYATRLRMTIEYNVYTQGVLSSKSVWKLTRK